MAKKKEAWPEHEPETMPRLTPNGKESQCIALAYELVEKRLRAGTATSQETTYFLRLGSSFNELEKRQLEEKIKLLEARTEAMESAKRVEALYTDAISAVTSYGSPATMWSAHD